MQFHILQRLMQALAAVGMSRRWSAALLVLLAATLGLRLAAAAGIPLVPEEAYYWMYSQHLSLSYYDHPPMVAWMIGAGTRVFGNTEWGVRFCGELMMLAASGLMYGFGRMWFGRNAALVAAVLIQALPVYFGAGLIATMDSGLVFFWLVGLVGVSVALRRQAPWGWYLAGVALGGAMLSKYTGVFLGAGAFLAVLGHPLWRRHLRSVHPYLASLLGFALFSPVVLWNAQHDWVSFRFQFADRFEDTHFRVATVGSYVAYQLAVATPLVLVGLGWLYGRTFRNWRRLQTPRWLMATGFSLPLLLVMSYKSLTYDIHVNWTLPLYLSALPAVARLGMMHWRRARKGSRRFGWAHAATATVAVCLAANLMTMVYVLALQPRLGWISALSPWRELAVAVENQKERLKAETGHEPLVIGKGRYRIASLVAFYRSPFNHQVRASDYTTSEWILGGHGLGYPYWATPEQWTNDCIVVGDDYDIDKFAPHFEQYTVVQEVQLLGKKKYRIAIGRGLRN